MIDPKIRDILATLSLESLLNATSTVTVDKNLISAVIKDSSIYIILEGAKDQKDDLYLLKELCEKTLKKNFPNHIIIGAISISATSSPKHIIAVGSGKGGVGKSTISVYLSLALKNLGYKVGLLDADVYGPSIPLMLGIKEKPKVGENKKILPIEKFGLKVMSIGFMIAQETPMIWRGPMVQGVLKQLLLDVLWGDLDFLILDLPPGTGDVQLTLAQQSRLNGAIIVSTPQDVALADAKKAIAMFKKVDVPILGLIENMSIFECPYCHHSTPIFSSEGVKRFAETSQIPFLGSLPINPDIGKAGDEGTPLGITIHESPINKFFQDIGEKIINSVQEIPSPTIIND